MVLQTAWYNCFELQEHRSQHCVLFLLLFQVVLCADSGSDQAGALLTPTLLPSAVGKPLNVICCSSRTTSFCIWLTAALATQLPAYCQANDLRTSVLQSTPTGLPTTVCQKCW